MAKPSAVGATTAGDFAGNVGNSLDLGVQSGLLEGLHAVVAIRGGETILERYFAGPDQRWGQPLGTVDFGPAVLHDLRSVTKSIVSLLYGIALDRGQVPATDTPLLAAFPQYPDLAKDPARAAWTVDHAFQMALGTEWNEDLPYDNPANSEIAMERASDRYRFILDRPVVNEPGTVWTYNGGCSALIGHLIEQGTGRTLSEFARTELFAPLGIGDHEWIAGADGQLSAASGLRLTAPGLARIGGMMLARGRWQGRQVVPADWIERCRTFRIRTSYGFGYSHQWYLSRQPRSAAGTMHPMISAHGNGGQRLFVLPDLDLVVVTYSGNYNRADQWMNPTLVLQKLVLGRLPDA